jgi:hypothetical protein
MPRGVPKSGKRKPRTSGGAKPKGKPLQKKGKKTEKQVKPALVEKLPKVPKAPKVPVIDVPSPEDVWEFEKAPSVVLPLGFVRLDPQTKVSLPADATYGLVKRRGFVVSHPENTRFCYVRWTDGCSYWVAADTLTIEKKAPTAKDQAKFYRNYDKAGDEAVESSDKKEPKDGQKTRRVSKGDSGGGTGVVGKTGGVDQTGQEASDRQRQEAVKALAVERANASSKITLYKAK